MVTRGKWRISRGQLPHSKGRCHGTSHFFGISYICPHSNQILLGDKTREFVQGRPFPCSQPEVFVKRMLLHELFVVANLVSNWPIFQKLLQVRPGSPNEKLLECWCRVLYLWNAIAVAHTQQRRSTEGVTSVGTVLKKYIHRCLWDRNWVWKSVVCSHDRANQMKWNVICVELT